MVLEIKRGAAGWGTVLHIGKSRVRFPLVSLEFFIDIILPAALWLLGRFSFKQKREPGIFPGGKAGWCLGLQPYHLHVPTVMKSGSLNLLKLSRPVEAWIGIDSRLPFLGIESEDLDGTVWRTRRGRDYGPFVKQTTQWMNINTNCKQVNWNHSVLK
jgi:hypothetical protein